MRCWFLAGFICFYCFCRNEVVSQRLIGCFEDMPERAMPRHLKVKGNNLTAECEKEAAFLGYYVFGIQNQVECWSGPKAHTTYYKYGRSTDCRNGLGGIWANSVYKVLIDGAALAKILRDHIANAKSIEDIDVGVFIESSSKLLNLSTSQWNSNPKVADNFLSASEGLLELGLNATGPVNATTDIMTFSVTNVDTNNKTSLVFPDHNDPMLSKEASFGSFVVPTIGNVTTANIGGYIYSNLHQKLSTFLKDTDTMFQSNSHQEIVSNVLSCQVNPPIVFGVNTNETIMVVLKHNTAVKSSGKAICAFWKHPETETTNGEWSTDGCILVSSNETHTECNCTHLTNFAILMQYQDVEVDDIHTRILTILTNVGCSLSLAALFLTVGIYVAFRLYHSTNFHIHTNLCFAIAFAQIFLLSAAQARHNKTACTVVSAFFHYFCLSIFTWMLVEGLQIYRKVVSIFSSSMSLCSCHLIGWGSPILVVVITYATRKEYYTDQKTCWLSTDYGIRWSFIGPVLLVILFNVMVTAVTLFKRLHLRSMATKEMAFKLRTSLRALLVLLPIFGVTWIIGIFGFTAAAVPAMYIFVILNSLQGVLIFIFHCAWNAEVRKAVVSGRKGRFSRQNQGTLSSQVNKIASIKNGNGLDSNSRNNSSSVKHPDAQIELPDTMKGIYANKYIQEE